MYKFGEHVGRVTEFGKVVAFDLASKRYTVLCNCGTQYTVKTQNARTSHLTCDSCFRKRQSEFGKLGNFVTNGGKV